jgi:8-oxo-dGTP pyrophosphatase MutT (NUDIX family)
MPTIVRKAFAYVAHQGRLLLLRHPGCPDAGVQVPAGTVEEGEDPEAAALREAREETGLDGLALDGFLGERLFDRAPYGQAELHRRFFYRLRCTEDPPETWRHWERTPSDGSPAPIALDFFWAPLPDGVPELIAGHGALLPELIAALSQVGDSGGRVSGEYRPGGNA